MNFITAGWEFHPTPKDAVCSHYSTEKKKGHKKIFECEELHENKGEAKAALAAGLICYTSVEKVLYRV